MTVPDRDASRRRRSVAMAGHAGGAERPAGDRAAAEGTARDGLGDAEPAVRATALGALSRLEVLRLADVKAATGDPHPTVRARAAELAPRVGPAAGRFLIDLLSDPRLEVVEATCFGLGELGATPHAVEALAEVAAGHSDPLCRETAVAALGSIGPVGDGVGAGRAAILAAMQDKPAVRRRAVLALAPFDGPEVDQALETALEDRDWQVRQAAEDLTGHRRAR